MNNKDPFETYLKNQNFSEKAPESLRVKLENSASWNHPWWKNPTTIAILTACLVVVISFLLLLAARSAAKPPIAPVAEQLPAFEEPVSAPPPPVVAQNDTRNPLSPFQQNLADAGAEFNLSFIDRPVNYFEARREYSDLI
ncbi:MAG: hypothetical protein CVV42_05905 [Candidatus Riflebacteria bacterium HGW-Riflebacteria-2]|jgi:hypothetical protein|nr:MAG: hypothetical protein CVV42_05905 [Candidatus Riflebacteria bacterium HGW-Riflebacteria-2]